jgi:uncharacterized protein YggE
MNEALIEDKKRNLKFLSFVLAFLALFLLVRTLSDWQAYWNQSFAVSGPTITVDGTGEVFAVPDIAQFTFDVGAKAMTVADAQKQSASIANAALAFLKKSNIADVDIKTSGYAVYPQYEASRTDIACISYPCPVTKQVFTGYQVTETFDVKVRDLAKVGDILDGLGNVAVTNMSGLTFTEDDHKDLTRQAREKAITDAQTKAKKLAQDLNVHLGRLASYNESGMYPYYTAYGMGNKADVSSASAPTPVSPGQNKITSSVTLVYEIR